MSRKAKYRTPADEYVFSPKGISGRALAIKWGLAYSNLSQHCACEGWVKRRREFWGRTGALVQEIAARELAGVTVKAAKQEMADLLRVRDEALARIFPPEGKKRPGMGGFARAVSALVLVDRQMLLRRGVPAERAELVDPRERYEERRRRFYHAQRTARAVNGLDGQDTVGASTICDDLLVLRQIRQTKFQLF